MWPTYSAAPIRYNSPTRVLAPKVVALRKKTQTAKAMVPRPHDESEHHWTLSVDAPFLEDLVLSKKLSSSIFWLGEPIFDRSVFVQGSQSFARAVLTAEVRQIVLQMWSYGVCRLDFSAQGLKISGRSRQDKQQVLYAVCCLARKLVTETRINDRNFATRLLSVALTDSCSGIRVGATRALLEWVQSTDKDILVMVCGKLLADVNVRPCYRYDAMVTLALFAPDRLFDEVWFALPYMDARLALTTIKFLTKWCHDRKASLLCRLTEHPEPDVAKAAIEGLSYVGDEGAQYTLVRHLYSDIPALQIAAAKVLGTVGGSWAARAICRLLEDEQVSWSFRRALRESWRGIQKRHDHGSLAELSADQSALLSLMPPS